MSTLSTLESYYDAAPRPTASTENVGQFTLFLADESTGWPYYARPLLALDAPVTSADVARVRARQREVGVPESIEWVHETTPSLLEAARRDGLRVEECPLLVLADPLQVFADPSLSAHDSRRVGREVTARLMSLDARSPELPDVIGVIDAGFRDTDAFTPGDTGRRPQLIRDGLLSMVAAYDESGAVGGGSHSPRGTTTELTGIAVLPRARRKGIGAAITHALVSDAVSRGIETIFLSAQDDAVARIYERVGFTRVGTACIAEAPRD